MRQLQGKNDEALSFYKGSLETYEKIFGNHSHPDMNSLLQRYASLLDKTGHSKDAADVRQKHHLIVASKESQINTKK